MKKKTKLKDTYRNNIIFYLENIMKNDEIFNKMSGSETLILLKQKSCLKIKIKDLKITRVYILEFLTEIYQ